MKRNWYKRIVDALEQEGITTLRDKEIYDFGLRQFLFVLINCVIAIMIGLFMRRVKELLLFLFIFFSLRRFTGGYHANNPIACSAISVALEIITLLATNLFPGFSILLLVAMIFSAVGIAVLSPVQVYQKNLDKIEKIVYRKKVIKLLYFWITGYFILSIFKQYYFSNTISITMNIVWALMLMGKAKNRFLDYKEEFS